MLAPFMNITVQQLTSFYKQCVSTLTQILIVLTESIAASARSFIFDSSASIKKDEQQGVTCLILFVAPIQVSTSTV